jgi:ketosteroid isomerase-like protein
VSEQAEAVVRGTYEAIGRGDVEAFLGAFAEDVEWYEAEGMPYGGLHQGRDAIAQNVLAPLIADVPDFAGKPEEYIASGDQVAVVVRYTGTGKETGKTLDMPALHLFDVRDGQITRFRQYADTVKFLEVVPREASVAA